MSHLPLISGKKLMVADAIKGYVDSLRKHKEQKSILRAAEMEF